MRRRNLLFMTWLLATTAAVLVASSAVSSVRASVTDTPAPLGLPRADRTTTTTTETDPEVPATVAPDTGEPAEPTENATDGSEEPQDTPDDASEVLTTTPPTTTPPPPTTTTTTQPPVDEPDQQEEVITYTTPGGWVTISITSDGIQLVGASPQAGWSVKPEASGPSEVVVKFLRSEDGSGEEDEDDEEDEGEVTFKATFDNGEVSVNIED